MRITLYLTPDEWRGLMQSLPQPVTLPDLLRLDPRDILLQDYRSRVTQAHLLRWISRKPRPYAHRLPLAVAVTLHQALPGQPCSEYQQLFLYQLDRALTNLNTVTTLPNGLTATASPQKQLP
jgi:hypothetical protein